MQVIFLQLRNNVTERNFVSAYSLLDLPLHAQRFGLAPSECPMAYNPDCTSKQTAKKKERENAAVLNFKKNPKK